MATTDIFRKLPAEHITDAILADEAQLFSEHYGIWNAVLLGRPSGKPGNLSHSTRKHWT